MRTPEIDKALEKTIAIKRLEKYLAAMDGDLSKALQLYEENMRLSECFYTPLQCLEVCLRNTLNLRMCATYGDDWLLSGTAGLDPGSIKNINDAIDSLRKDRQTEDPDHIVAELNLGFWVGLLGPSYDATLWRNTLYKGFQATGGGQKRSVVHGRFNALRRFRNRVAHHEPIYFKPLEQFHAEIIEAIGWMCKHTSAWTMHHSRFDEVSTTSA
jgi:Abi-like protein